MVKVKKRFITKAGLDKLNSELKERMTIIRKKIADKLDEAKALGDLSENSAYISALEDYQFNETRINELKDQIPKLKVAPDRRGDLFVDIGDKVEIKDLKNEKILSYHIVGEGEGDPSKNQISANSAVGIALVGKKVGQKVKIKLTAGEKEYEIVKVS